MDMQEYFHMSHGEGEFSYAHNSSAVPGILFTQTVKPAVENVIKYQLLHNITKQYKVLKVADLGCGIGPTPVNFIATVIETMHKVCKEMKNGKDDQVSELQIYMSDLPSTDFNMLFKDALKLQGQTRDGTPLCFVMGAPGSFYGRLFPAKSLHFVHSSASLHWLSQVPLGVRSEDGVELNKGNILASHTSTPYIQQTYFAQFKHDFTSFLTCRSQEVVTNAHMLLSFAGRKSIKICEPLMGTHIYQALARLVSKGVITEEKLESFNMPVYFPCKEEVEDIIKEEGSFEIENMKVTIDVAASDLIKDNQLRAEAIGKFMRCILETLISYHFGAQIWDTLPTEHNQVILEHLNSDNNEYYNVHFTILLKKKLDY
ncbi:hypothetical protein RND81_08G212500 [Saponaria officinalis]|uniref:Uncharacterized protein n=1 Tax=Saponaria officinalis TaxID=3572 RepID=A0AAW1JCC9_SAPOF